MIKFLKGERKLWQAFWFTWVLPQVILGSYISERIYIGNYYSYIMWVFFYLAVTIFGFISVWRCAPNCKVHEWGDYKNTARELLIVWIALPFVIMLLKILAQW